MGFEHTRRAHDIKRAVANRLPEEWARSWEDRTRRNALEKGGYTYLSDLVSFGIDPEYPDDILLHIHENLTKTPIGAMRLMLEGLKALANRLENDPELVGIETISGHSWIVYNSPDILRRLGFEVSNVDDRTKTAFATIDRNAFIDRYKSR